MQTLAVTEAVTTIAEAERKFGLRRSESRDFFTEWYDQLPVSNSSDHANLEIIWRRYIYHRSGGHLLESTVMLLLVSPLLTIAGLYDPPFRIDVLVLRDRLWIIVLESKKTMLSVWSALPQTLAYLMASPNGDHPTFAMLTNGDDIVFVKLEGKQYAMSQVLSPLVNRGELEVAWQVLRKIAEIEV